MAEQVEANTDKIEFYTIMKNNFIQMLRRLSCLFIVLVASAFISSYTYMTDNKPTNTQPSYRIGYSTSYSNGQFNSTQYNSMVPKSYYGNQPYRGFENRGIYTGTYTPASYSYESYGGSSSSDGSHGQPRRVVIHNPNNPRDSLDTHLDNDYHSDWTYYHGGLIHNWYYRDSNGNYYYWDESYGGWKPIWSIVGLGLGVSSIDKNAHSSVPIGDGVGIMLFLAVMMAIYIAIKDKRRMSQRNSW